MTERRRKFPIATDNEEEKGKLTFWPTEFKTERQHLVSKKDDRRKHVYIVGKLVLKIDDDRQHGN